MVVNMAVSIHRHFSSSVRLPSALWTLKASSISPNIIEPLAYSPTLQSLGNKFCQQKVSFVLGAAQQEQFPARMGRAEAAFAGRSNVGKSTLLNNLFFSPAGANKLAHSSKTPGRTQQLNFFSVSDKMTLVDLPGYGFASAPKTVVQRWNLVVGQYVRSKRSAAVHKEEQVPANDESDDRRRIMLLIDSRRGLLPIDQRFISFLEDSQVFYQLVFTKVDRVSSSELMSVLSSTADVVQRQRLEYLVPWCHVVSCNKHRLFGLPELRNTLLAMATDQMFLPAPLSATTVTPQMAASPPPAARSAAPSSSGPRRV